MSGCARANPDVFAGTRVPGRALIDYIEGDHALDEFLTDFPTP